MIASLFSSLLPSFSNASLENPAVSIGSASASDWFGGGKQSEAGVNVTPHLAMMVPAFWQAGSIISGDMASMPLNVHKRSKEDDRAIDIAHPSQYLLTVQPNDEMSAFELLRRWYLHAFVYGNGYLYIGREGRVGDPRELINLLPDRTTPARTERGELYYMTEVDGKLEPLFKEEVLHLKGMSLQNGQGLYLAEMARNCLGLALAAEGFASKFFANGSQMGGILEVPASMTPKAADNLEEGWRKRTGKDHWFRTVVLRDGAKFHSVTIDPQKSQLNALREEQARDVARFANLPGSKLGLKESMSYNSAQQDQQAYWTGCLFHWSAAAVGECTIKLLTEKQRRKDTHYLEHNKSVLLEGDVKTMNETLEIQRRNEIISANEWRRKINLNKRTDPGGDEYLNPNTRSPEQTATADDNEPEPAKASNMLPKLKAKLSEDITCMAKRLGHNAREKSKDQAKFIAWLDSAVAANQRVFDEKLKSTVSLVAEYLESDESALFCCVSGRFFSEFTTQMDVKAAGVSIQKAVSEACDSFEQTIFSTIETLVFGDS